jgi:hypothetical protein
MTRVNKIAVPRGDVWTGSKYVRGTICNVDDVMRRAVLVRAGSYSNGDDEESAATRASSP